MTGDNKPRAVCVRLLALTNRDLPAEIAVGRFREDLYYRIGVTTVRVPPLRERAGDIDLLIDHFNAALVAHHGLPALALEPEARALLRAHDWPGNVRELRNVIESLLLTGGAEPVSAAVLPPSVTGRGSGAAERAAETGGAGLSGGLEESERRTITAAIAHHGGKLSRTARHLGVSRSTLYRKLGRYAIAVD